MKEKKKPPIYLLDHKLKWKAFKILQDKLVKDSGLIPVHGDKTLWEMMKAKRLLCWFDPYVEGDMRLGLKLPKNRRIRIITNPSIKI